MKRNKWGKKKQKCTVWRRKEYSKLKIIAKGCVGEVPVKETSTTEERLPATH